ncbi:MAG: pentapeptide repeat-containing protein [Flavobacteriales bacterium]|nr:pentapeptide repeat-containing protein [Flavobacteriales bacterium]
MPTSYHQDRTFTGSDLPADQLANAEFEGCTFRQCAWGSVDLSNARFTDCVFEQCDLSTAITKNTAFRTVRFDGCKLLGLQFDRCSAFLFAVRFNQCRLDFASFRSVVLKKTTFSGCRLHEADFSGADLSGATLDDCDLAGAVFEGTNLEQTDFRTAHNFIIDPQQNRVKLARFSTSGLPGLLMRYQLVIE